MSLTRLATGAPDSDTRTGLALPGSPPFALSSPPLAGRAATMAGPLFETAVLADSALAESVIVELGSPAIRAAITRCLRGTLQAAP